MAEENNNYQDYEEFESIDLSSLEQMAESFPDLSQEEQNNSEEEYNFSEEENKEENDSIDDSEESQENQTEDDNKEEPSSQDTDDSSPLTPYAKMLVEEGLLPNIDLEKFDGSVESLLEAQRQYDEERFNSFKESTLDPRVKWLQDRLEDGVPLKELLELEEQKFTLDNVDETTISENEDLQKNILRNYYRETTNFNDEKINRLIERLETIGDLETESKSSFEELKEIMSQKEQQQVQTARQAREQAIKQQEQTLKEFRETLDKTEEIIKGVKVSPLIKDKIFKTLTTPVAVDEQTGTPINKIAEARAKDPLNFEINLAYIFEVTNGFKDWGVFSTPGKRKAISEFQDSLKNLELGKENYKKQDTRTSKEARSYLKEMEELNKLL